MKEVQIKEQVSDAIAAAESVISDEIAALSPAWRSYLPKWKTYNRTKKAIAIAVPAIGIALAFWLGGITLHSVGQALHLGRATEVVRSYVPAVTYESVTKAELAEVKRASENALSHLERSTGEYRQEVDVLKKHIEVLDDTIAQLAIELRATAQRIADLPTAAPKQPAKSQITTGSLPPKGKPKAKPFDITDPSTWPKP